MRYDIRQTCSSLTAKYQFVSDECSLGGGMIDTNFIMGGSFHFSFLQDHFDMIYQPKEQAKSWIKQSNERLDMPYSLLKNGERCGQIGIRTSKGNFLTRFEYYGLTADGKEYEMYMVGLGKEGIKYPIYCQAQQIALIEKSPVVRNQLDVYQVYACDERAAEVAAVFGLYLDASIFANRGQIVSTSVEKTFYLTTNRRLKATYDSTFKAKLGYE